MMFRLLREKKRLDRISPSSPQGQWSIDFCSAPDVLNFRAEREGIFDWT